MADCAACSRKGAAGALRSRTVRGEELPKGRGVWGGPEFRRQFQNGGMVPQAMKGQAGCVREKWVRGHQGQLGCAELGARCWPGINPAAVGSSEGFGAEEDHWSHWFCLLALGPL